MLLQVKDTRLKLLGDPHLGRQFINGVPLEKRGVREQMQWEAFERSLFDVKDVDVHICVGDLFDKFVVAPEVVLKAADIYRQAADLNPGVDYIVIRGNHDGSRDSEKRSSFDIFSALLSADDGIKVFAECPVALEYGETMLGFCPWHPFNPAVDMLPGGDDYDLIVGHWDLDSFGNDENPNLIPLKELARKTSMVVTGHVHTPEERYFTSSGQWTKDHNAIPVIVTGSIMPMSHGEDPNGDTYVTVTVDELENRTDLADKCVRVLLEEGQEMPEAIDCLQFTVKRVKKVEDDQPLEVKMEDFDFQTLFRDTLTEAGVNDDTIKVCWGMYEEEREC